MTDAAQGLAHFTMSRDWVILRASLSAMPWITPAVGQRIWDIWPAAEPVFRPIHERAWRDGYAYGREFFLGVLYDVQASVVGDELRVMYDEIFHVDVTTPETVAESLAAMIHLCRGPGHPETPPPHPAPLRVVPGAGL